MTSMKADHPEENIQSRRVWWRKRVNLDLEMASLLERMESELLGPWKYVPLPNSFFHLQNGLPHSTEPDSRDFANMLCLHKADNFLEHSFLLQP